MTSAINNYKSVVSGTNETANTKSSTSTKSGTPDISKNSISQDQFLNLLVNQLKNQDPLNPMDNQEFAVQLAQFSQLEQLVQLNNKLGANSTEGASMASYLGNEVAFSDNMVRVNSGTGSNLAVNIPAGTQSLRVDLLDSDGASVGTVNYDGAVVPGQQMLALENLNVADGKYQARVVSVGANGRFVALDAKATGTVSGFVMEPEPKLLVGGEEVAIADVSAVFKGV